jgi:hypothetical protein
MKKSLDHVEKEYSFLEKEWTVLRVGWLLLTLFVLAGLLGLFGGGPLSRKTTETRIGRIEYERFLRHSTSSTIIFESDQPLKDSSLYINREYLRNIKIDQIEPRPESSGMVGSRIRFKFPTNNSRQIIFHISPFEGSGTHTLEIGTAGQKEVIQQFIYF